MCLAKDKDQARIVFRYVKAILNHIPALKDMIVDQRADEIELTSGVTIIIKASDFGGVRGPTIACVVADEIAFWPTQGANPDDEVLSAIRPAMATIPDASSSASAPAMLKLAHSTMLINSTTAKTLMTCWCGRPIQPA